MAKTLQNLFFPGATPCTRIVGLGPRRKGGMGQCSGGDSPGNRGQHEGEVSPVLGQGSASGAEGTPLGWGWGHG